MLSVINVHTYYGESHVLQGVTLSVEKGSVTAVLGRNGVGKTTLCKTVVGLAPARAGRIVLDGADITRLPPHKICRIHMGLVPQGRRIFRRSPSTRTWRSRISASPTRAGGTSTRCSFSRPTATSSIRT